MPFYEYICSSCKEEQLLFHSMSEDLTDTACPSCGADKLVRLISSLEREVKVHSTPKSRIKDFIKSSKDDLDIEKNTLKGRGKK